MCSLLSNKQGGLNKRGQYHFPKFLSLFGIVELSICYIHENYYVGWIYFLKLFSNNTNLSKRYEHDHV